MTPLNPALEIILLSSCDAGRVEGYMSIRGFLAACLAVVGVIITVMAGLLISDR